MRCEWLWSTRSIRARVTPNLRNFSCGALNWKISSIIYKPYKSNSMRKSRIRTKMEVLPRNKTRKKTPKISLKRFCKARKISRVPNLPPMTPNLISPSRALKSMLPSSLWNPLLLNRKLEAIRRNNGSVRSRIRIRISWNSLDCCPSWIRVSRTIRRSRSMTLLNRRKWWSISWISSLIRSNLIYNYINVSKNLEIKLTMLKKKFQN